MKLDYKKFEELLLLQANQFAVVLKELAYKDNTFNDVLIDTWVSPRGIVEACLELTIGNQGHQNILVLFISLMPKEIYYSYTIDFSLNDGFRLLDLLEIDLLYSSELELTKNISSEFFKHKEIMTKKLRDYLISGDWKEYIDKFQ